MNRVARIEALLQQALQPTVLDIVDDSAAHAGHAGAAGGAGHYKVVIASARFEGLGRIARHRAVYEVLAGLMNSDIHALNITAMTPDEARAQST